MVIHLQLSYLVCSAHPTGGFDAAEGTILFSLLRRLSLDAKVHVLSLIVFIHLRSVKVIS